MSNITNKRIKMDELDPNERNKNFEEVATGYSEEQAISEAKRCLDCKTKPCVNGCPVNVRIPEFINCVAKGDFRKAYEIITSTNFFPAICGRVCPQENQCESQCVRGKKGEPIAIGRLERFVADWHRENEEYRTTKIEPCKNKVAVVGSGPSGLACANELAKNGYDVTIYEALHKAGGVLSYGIPGFRLPKSVVEYEITNLINLGVKIEKNVVLGKTISIDELLELGYSYIYLSTGAGLPRFMGIQGERLLGVYSANEFLTRINLMNAQLDNYDTPIIKPKNVAVIGGGNVAMDAARCAKRLMAENVYVLYRRSKNEMPARLEEIFHAEEEGIEFKFLVNPIRILGDEDDKVKSIECVRMRLSEPDESGRKKPIEQEGSNFFIDVDCVIMAIGTLPNPVMIDSISDIKKDKRGYILVDQNQKTSNDFVYAGGDAVTGAATVILAMAAGKNAAEYIIKNDKK